MKRRLLVLAWVLWTVSAQHEFEVPRNKQQGDSECYTYKDGRKIARRCVPEFVNVAFNREVYASNTCGEAYPIKYCQQTGNQHIHRECNMCDSRMEEHKHPARYLTDYNDPDQKTWWQSETMAQGLKGKSVNLTINFGKAFDVTYVRLSFISPRPESFAIYKRVHSDGEWIPWQYYSASCRNTYHLADKAPILPGNEAIAQCNSDPTDITPLTDGKVPFSTLEGRPSAEAFEESDVLQNWVIATDVLIKLDRMNTYGDEIYQDERVLQSYFYAISDLAIGGRCTCHGHASSCPPSTGQGVSRLACRCEHNTVGVDCGECDPFFQDRPWRAATSTEANECLPCDCNGLSKRCFFDEALYNSTGHGGHCIDCMGNTQGIHCQDCVPKFWRKPGEKQCSPCVCSEIGSTSEQCDEHGQCPCKSGVGTKQCGRCSNGFYDFGSNGCESCHCSLAGSLQSDPMCSQETGQCRCKDNVEGQHCDRCKPGFFNLDSANPRGCSPCFCYGHSSNCSTAYGYYRKKIVSTFEDGVKDWTAGSLAGPEQIQYDSLEKAIVVSQTSGYPVYFYLPDKFLGDLRFAYNQLFGFTLRTMFDSSAVSASDIKIVGANDRTLILSILSCSTSTAPGIKTQQFYFWLNPEKGWSPRLRDIDFISVLSNITEFSIRGTYAKGDLGYLYNFTLETATNLESPPNQEANWVERCSCGKEYDGQFCEKCAPGYKRFHKFGGPTSRCVSCSCNNHSQTCDAESGDCFCKHNTASSDCSQCARGYYGNALDGEPDSCKSCDCPDGGPCVIEGDQIYCTECPVGSTGQKCEFCTDDYYKDALTGKCTKCKCNGNLDPNAIGNCDQVTGKCLRCIHQTTGDRCQRCKLGFWGDAAAEEKPSCRPCNCFPPGTKRPINKKSQHLACNQKNGQCDCLTNVIGQRCEKCQDGYFNIVSRSGCEPCNCDPIGSLNSTCDPITGQCTCKPGTIGDKCDTCGPLHFDFSSEGCKRCSCNKFGAESDECDVNTGQCLCRDHAMGQDCSYCEENWYSLERGCSLECDDCYRLIQKRKNQINDSTQDFKQQLRTIIEMPVKIDDAEFKSKLDEMAFTIDQLNWRAQNTTTLNYDKIKTHLNETSAVKAKFDKLVQELDELGASVELSLEELEDSYGRLNRHVNNELHNLQKDGQQLLRELNERRLTSHWNEASSALNEISKTALETLAEISSKTSALEELATKFELTSKQAFAEANETVFAQEPYGEKVANLQIRVRNLTKEFTDLHQLDQYYQNDLQKLVDQTATQLGDIDERPNMERLNKRKDNTTWDEGVRSDFKRYISDAKKQKNKLANYTQKRREAEKELIETNIWLNKVQNETRKTERQVERAEEYRKRASAAMDKANRAYENAEKTLGSIKEFTEDPERNLERYLQELQNIGELNTKLDMVERQLVLLEVNVPRRQFEIEEVQTNAEFAKQRAGKFKEDSEELQNIFKEINDLISRQKNELNNLHADLSLINDTQIDHEASVVDISKQAKETLLRAIQANQTAYALSDRIDKTADLMEEALRVLISFELPTDQKLDQLEDELKNLEELVRQMGLEKSFNEAKHQMGALEQNSLKAEVLRLEAEYKNLQAIYDNLPSKCFNVVKLESP